MSILQENEPKGTVQVAAVGDQKWLSLEIKEREGCEGKRGEDGYLFRVIDIF